MKTRQELEQWIVSETESITRTIKNGNLKQITACGSMMSAMFLGEIACQLADLNHILRKPKFPGEAD